MATPIASIQAQEVGKVIKFTQNSSAPNFTGATVYLLVKNSSGTVNTYTCDVVSNAPQYTTTGAEFPSAGSYTIQLKYVNSGEVYFTSEATIKVLSNLV